MLRIVGLRKNPVSADCGRERLLAAWVQGRAALREALAEDGWAGRLGACWREETGQDMVEYALLLGFVALTGVAFYISMGATVTNIWGIVNNRLAAANQSVS